MTMRLAVVRAGEIVLFLLLSPLLFVVVTIFFVVVVTAIVIVIVTTTITKINVPGRLQQAWVAGFQLTLLDVFVRK